MAIRKVHEYMLKISALLCILKDTTSSSRLVQLNGCICPDDDMTYQCTICDDDRYLGSATTWTGSLFDCAGNGVTLRHSQFESGTVGECNNGEVIARSIEVMNAVNGSRCYVSQLNFVTNMELNNKTVTCLHVSSTNVTEVGSLSVILITESLPPPYSIHLGAIGPTYLTFHWNHDNAMNIQTDTCSSLVYNIFALDCGVCPNSTNSLSVTCTNITTTGPTCSFEVESVICDHLISNRSEPLTTSLKVPDAPKLEGEQFFISSSPNSSLIHTALNQVHPVNISDGVDGSVISYTITYYDSTSQNICALAVISVSPYSCTDLICRHVFDVSASPCHLSTEITVVAAAANVFGNGSVSTPIHVTITTLPKQPVCLCNCSNTTETTARDGDYGVLASLGSGALAVFAILLSTVFIIVVTILARSRAKIERQLKEIIGQSAQEMNPTSPDYETIDLSQNRELHISTIDTKDNAAYGNLSKLD